MTSRPTLLLVLTFLLTVAAAPILSTNAPNVALAAEPVVPPLDERPFGLNTHLATRHIDLATMHVPADLIADSGAGWAREDIHWWRIQPSEGVWDWSFTDQAIRLLINRDIKIVGVLGHPPGWATPYPDDTPSDISFYAPDQEQFAAFAGAVVKRYGKYVDHWEVWNEPDNVLFWKPTPNPEDYASLLKLTTEAIREQDADAQVLLGGINPFDTDFLRRVAEAGAWDSFDILAIHPYVDPVSPEAGNIGAAVDGVQTLAARYGEKPLWATEVGWSTGPGDHDKIGVVDEQMQADYIVRSMLLLWRSGVERTFWYTLKDDPGNPYGLLALGASRDDYSVIKPSFTAFQTLNRQLGGASFVHMLDLFDRTPVFDFETFGAWRRGDQPYGTLRPTSAATHGGRAAAALNYSFPSAKNDYVVFVRERPITIPQQPYALGLWVYGDGSGNTLKVWLRDAEGELLQYPLGTVGPAGWRLLKAPIGGPVAPWDQINKSGNGQLDFPASLYALVLDDAPDTFAGRGTIYLDDLTALSGPEAYNLQVQRGNTLIDVLWSPEEVRVKLPTAAPGATLVEWDGRRRQVEARDGQITSLALGAAPRYVVHQRATP